MGLTRLAVYRPLIILVALVSIIMFGIVSYLRLGLDQVPEIKIPIVTVQAVYPGAGPREVEEQVTRKIEDALAGLNDVVEIRSVSTQNIATITVEFREAVNIDLVALDVERTVNNIRRELPTEVEAPTTRKLDLNDQPIIYLALTNRGTRDPTEMRRIADDVVRPRLESLEGISRATVLGGRKAEVQVSVNPERLRAFRLSVADVWQAVSNQYQTVSGGTVTGGQADPNREFSLRVEGRDRDPSSLATLTIAGRDGASTELRNVAEISMAGADQAAIVRLNGKDAVGILISKQGQANITLAADKVLAEIGLLNAELPTDLRLEVIIDRSEFIRSSVRDVYKELAVAAFLTGLVLLLFLHTFRATVIVLVAIPTCVIAAFIVMRQTGITLNILSLLGLTTSIGILVDDSIVVLENIFRKLEQGDDPKTAAVRGRSEIGLAAMAITLVDVVVYGPIVFLEGTTGGFLRNFAIVVTAATLASLLVSFTLTPMMASRWLNLGPERGWIARAASSWEPLYRAMERNYGVLLGWSLRHRLVVLLGSIAILVASFGMVPFIGAEFVPDIDGPFIAMSGELPGGSTLEATDRAARLWERRLLDPTRYPEVRQVYMVVGSGSTELERGSRFLSVIAELEKRGHRALLPGATRARTSSEIRRAGLEEAGGIPGLSTSVGGNRPGGTGQALQVRLIGRDMDELSRVAAEAQRRLAARPELADLTNSTAAVSPEVTARVDQKRVQDLGLTTQQVGAAVRVAYQGIVAAKWPRPDGTEVDIRVRMPESVRKELATLQGLPLVTARGSQVTLGQVADLSQQPAPARINRIQRQRVAILGAEPKGVPLGTASGILREEMAALALPSTVRWELAGQSKEQQQAFTNLAIALGASVILVYLVLTALYESLILPLVVLSSLPLALIGALAGLLLFKNTLNILSLIGVIALFGLVGKNAILLVDYTNQLRKRGVERNEALRLSGPARLRPIIMTSATLVLSLMPVAVQLGEGGELRAPLAAVVIGGMISSTILTLVFVPVSYTYFDGLQRRILVLFHRGWRRQRTPPAPSRPSLERAPVPAGAHGNGDGRDGERRPERPRTPEEIATRRR